MLGFFLFVSPDYIGTDGPPTRLLMLTDVRSFIFFCTFTCQQAGSFLSFVDLGSAKSMTATINVR